jgi:hypothetical protein
MPLKWLPPWIYLLVGLEDHLLAGATGGSTLAWSWPLPGRISARRAPIGLSKSLAPRHHGQAPPPLKEEAVHYPCRVYWLIKRRVQGLW